VSGGVSDEKGAKLKDSVEQIRTKQIDPVQLAQRAFPYLREWRVGAPSGAVLVPGHVAMRDIIPPYSRCRASRSISWRALATPRRARRRVRLNVPSPM
jgi:hypothetical protein